MSKKRLKVGANAKLLVGSPSIRGKIFKIIKIVGNYLHLEGHTHKRSSKINEKNTENFIQVAVPVHVSNVKVTE